MPSKLEITYAKSAIGRSKPQVRTIEALGLRKLHQQVVHNDTPSIRGMINSVNHLVTWREIEEGESA